MKILVACEFSGRVRDAFISKGHYAVSCDLEPTEVPGPHYQGSVFDIINDGWDIMIAHPPCKHLAVCGRKNWGNYTDGEQQEALNFVMKLLNAPIPKIALENPIGIISTQIRKPDQYIHPFMFGHPTKKKTGLWLKNLPKLVAENVVEYNDVCEAHTIMARITSPVERSKARSRTYIGIAQAMANQWG